MLPGTDEEYIDLVHVMPSLRVSLRTTVVVPQAAAAEVPKVGPVNNFMYSLFNQVVLFFNQKPVSPQTIAYTLQSEP